MQGFLHDMIWTIATRARLQDRGYGAHVIYACNPNMWERSGERAGEG